MPDYRYRREASRLRKLAELPIIGLGALVFFMVFLASAALWFVLHRDIADGNGEWYNPER